MFYTIDVKNVGREPEPVYVFDNNGRKRLALFSSKTAATEACRIIRELRTDNAFQTATAVPLHSNPIAARRIYGGPEDEGAA